MSKNTLCYFLLKFKTKIKKERREYEILRPTKGHTLQDMGTTKDTIGRTNFFIDFAPLIWEYYVNGTTRI